MWPHIDVYISHLLTADAVSQYSGFVLFVNTSLPQCSQETVGF